MVIHVYPNCCHKVRYSFLPEFSYAAIQLDINQLIDMNYFLLLFYLSTDDLSFQKVASQSTWYEPDHNARFAVDRNPTTWAKTYDIGRNSISKTVWWKVDLGGVYNIYSITILFRHYDGYGIV